MSLKHEHLNYDLLIANSVSTAKEYLSSKSFDVILLDHNLGDGSGFDVLNYVAILNSLIPVIFVTGAGAEDIAIKAMKEGASDYLKKDINGDYLALLPLTIENAIKSKQTEQELERHKLHLEKLVTERTENLSQEIEQRKSIELQLIEEKECIQVTLNSIGDAVISTDIRGVIDFINPVAEQLTGWNLQDAKGQNLEKVFNIVNEATRLRCENPVERCLREEKIIGLANHTVLLSKNGKDVAIEDSAAPIRNSKGDLIGVVLVFHDVTQARRMAQELTYQASHDPLTNLHNRREFERRIHNSINTAFDRELEHAMLYIDLDQFKIVNDTCGHVAGDELLRQIATVLSKPLREGDTLARLGGDEFGILLENCHLDKAALIAQNLCDEVKSYHFVWDKQSFHIGASIGVVDVSKHTKTLSNIMTSADIACYAAKKNGRNGIHVVYADDVEVDSIKDELLWLSTLRDALQNENFVLYFQKVSEVSGLSNNRNFEVLLRLQIDDKIISPASFIPAAERYQLMPDIDRWVISTAFKLYQQQDKSSFDSYKCSINLCGSSLSAPTLIEYIIEQQIKYEINPQHICFEVTETDAIANLTKAASFMNELRTKGYRFALDDFGSGMSSFAYLKNLPIDFLKIDGLFVKDIADDAIDYAMVKSINEIGHAMGLKTIAEFVENQSILDKLQEIGVDYIQGYHIHKPENLANLS